MAVRCSDDTDDSQNMLNSIHEQHKVHSVARVHLIKVFQLLIANFFHVFKVCDFTVDIQDRSLSGVIIRIDGRHEGSPQERLHIHDVTPIFVKVLFDEFFELFFEEFLILAVDESVLEHPHTLVSPNFDKLGLIAAALVVNLEDSLKDF